jgi:DNA polymerase III alpha subunit
MVNKKVLESLIRAGACDKLRDHTHHDLIDSSIDDIYNLNWEKELLGVYLTEHPVANLEIKTKTNYNVEDVFPESEEIRVGGLISSLRKIQTRRDQTMGTFQLEDTTGAIEVTVFPKAYARYKSLIKEDGLIVIQAKVTDIEEEGVSLILESAWSLEEAEAMKRIMEVTVQDNLVDVLNLARENRGDNKLFLKIDSHKIQTGFSVNNQFRELVAVL